MGFACARIDVSAAIDGGSGASGALDRRCAAACGTFTNAPAAAEAHRKARREIMRPSFERQRSSFSV
jgi:hypothetical protein